MISRKENPIINKFIKNQRKKRAFKHLNKLTGIDIEKQSQQNILAIYHRLKTGMGLPDAIREDIRKEKIKSTDILTPAELVLFESLLSIPLIANHATFNKDIITSKSLYSSKELARRNIPFCSHTPQDYGEDDFIFFSYSLPEKKEIVNFINKLGAMIIYVNLDQLLQVDPITYSHMWTSGHFYAYDNETTFRPTSFETKGSVTEVHIYNQVTIEKGLQYQRKFIFSHHDQKIQQVWKRESEISAGRHIKPFHMLRLIEFIRYLDPKNRNHILKEHDNRKLLSELFYSVFTPGKAELHVPSTLHMDSLLKSSTELLYSWDHVVTKNFSAKEAKELFDSVMGGDNEKIKKIVEKTQDWRTLTASYIPGTSYLPLLNVAVIDKQYDIVETLLSHGADPDDIYENAGQFDFLFTKAHRHALQDAIELKDFRLIKSLSGEYKNQNDFYTIKMIATVQLIDLYTAIAVKVDIKIFEYLFQRYHDDASNLLMIAVLYDNTTALSYLLNQKINANMTHRLHINLHNAHLIPMGMAGHYTPLTLAAELGRVRATEILLESKADPNVVIKDSGQLYKHGKGLSPLIIVEQALQSPDYSWYDSYLESKKTRLYFKNFALPKKDELSTIKRLLLDAGADSKYHPIKCHTTRYFNHEIYALISGINENKEPVLLLAEKPELSETHFFMPGGKVNYEIDKDMDATLIRWTHALVHVDLEDAKLVSVDKYLDSKEDAIVKIAHYSLKKPIEDYNIPKNTYNSGYLEWRFKSSQLHLENIQFVPLKQIKMEIIKYNSVLFPVFTFQNKAIPSIYALQMAELLGVHTLRSPDSEALIFSMHNHPYEVFKSEIKKNNIDNIKSLLRCRLPLRDIDYCHLIKHALDLQHYNIVKELMTVPFILKLEIFYYIFYTNSMHFVERSKIPPEEIVINLFLRCQDLTTTKYVWHVARYAGFTGFLQLMELIIKINGNLLYDIAEGAAIHSNITSLKWVLSKIPSKEKSSLIKKLLNNKLKLAVIEFLLDEYSDDEPASKSLLSRMVDNYCEAVQEKVLDLQAAYLTFIERLIDKGYQDGYRTIWDVYSELQSSGFLAPADLLLQIIIKSPVLEMQYAEKIESMDELDRIISTYATHPLLKRSFFEDKYFFYSNINIYFQRAILKNSIIIVKFILENGFNHRFLDIDLPDQMGFTPLQNARRLHYANIEKLLLAHGATDNENEFKKSLSVNLSNAKIIIFSETSMQDDKQSKTGDEDYIAQLKISMDSLETKTEVCRNFSPSENKNAILHLMINAPRTGCAMDEKHLKALTDQGCRVVVTAIEFAKHQDKQYKTQTMTYLQYAEKIIFLDEHDQKDALQFAKSHHPSLIKKIIQSTVIPVPPTISAQYISQEKKGSDIICFGMIRSGKGFAHITRLAKLIKKSKDPLVNKKTIYIVGSVQKHKTRNNGTEYDATLYRLLCQLYPTKKHEFQWKTPSQLVTLVSQLEISPELPIKLYLDVEEVELTALFQQCEYAFNPAYRGATLRNSSISTELAFGCIIYSHMSETTPASLLKDGEFHQSMVLFDNDLFDSYAKNVLSDICFREQNKLSINKYDGSLTYNDKTRKMADQLLKTMLSPAKIAKQHLDLYAALPKPILKKKSEVSIWCKLFKKKSKGEEAGFLKFNWKLTQR